MSKKEALFIQLVTEYYKTHGRQKLPWRLTHDPYRILVSEIMLQQTQVDRVIPKYESFIKKFPSIRALSQASLGEVLRAWQGLGYNRRAKMLHECARIVRKEYGGAFPKEYALLVKLPGIGPYTAGAIMAFAFDVSVPIIETNIRSVYIHHFFNDSTDVTDTEIMKVIARTLDHTNPRDWYYALMDYGAYIKKTHGNPNSRSKHYARQSIFDGSDRQIRGAIVRRLSSGPSTRKQLVEELGFEDLRIDAQLEKLGREGMIIKNRSTYRLP